MAIIMKTQKFSITGMTCSACQAHVEKAVNKLNGVDSVCVNLLSNSMEASFDEKKLSNKDIINAVKSAGYGAKEFVREENITDNAKNNLILSIVFLIPLMFISMSHMLGIHIPALDNMTILGICEAAFLIPILILNRKYFISGFKSLIKLNPNMDALIALGAGISTIYSIYNFVISAMDSLNVSVANQLGIHFYFESAGMILTFISIGKYLESKSKNKTSSAISKLIKLTPKTAVIEINGTEKSVNTSELKPGDIVICKNGLSIPVDGIIIDGSCSIDESAITGESIPVDKATGDTVTGGTTLTSGYIRIKAVNTGENTALAKIIKLVEDATGSKAPIARIADKVAAVFVPTVIAIALITTVIWLIVGAGFDKAVSFGIAVLVISCPCALGLATPTAITVGTGKAAQYGILIKSAEALETANKIKTVILDKTGTVTMGEPKVTDVLEYDDKLISIAYSIEKQSEHPLAKAVCTYAESKNIKSLDAQGFKSYTGSGVSAEINGETYYAGNYGFIQKKGISFNNNSISELYNKGKTPLLFANRTKVIGIIAVADTIKPTSKDAVSGLRNLGVQSVMLTGDNKQTANYIQKQSGIKTAYAQVLPHQKEQVVRSYKNNGVTAMVGDGINDSPALVTADVGIAIGAGTDIAIDSADIVLMKSDLIDVVTTIELSRAVLKNIKENLFWAFIYNIICIPLAAGAFYTLLGWQMQPMYGTIAMSLSSICVVTNALRLKRFKPKTNLQNDDKISDYTTKTLDDTTYNTKTVDIKGMMCEHCVARVKAALETISETPVIVSLENGNAIIDESVENKLIKKVITDAGYSVIDIR
ncbi:MAG: heavy metal translocating P-type ATPase [Ruminococcus sp.]|nr:heavy metal translocating P-type ATPase [Ruminococcus sp.]